MDGALQKTANPYLIAAVVSMATFMEVLDTTIANVALSSIAGSLGAGAEESTWVLTSYLVSNGIVLPLSGWLSDLLGRKRFFLLCIGGFTLTSFLCGVSVSLPMLIVSRLLQGLAGGGLQPTQQAIIRDSFPPEKLGTAFAITGVTIVLAPIIGPVLGGYITDHYSWRWIFFMNVPVGVLVAGLVKLLIDEPAAPRRAAAVDCIGLGLIALGLGALQIVLDKGQQEDWFDSTLIVGLSIIALLGLTAAVLRMLRQKDPVVKIRLLALPSFGMPCAMIFFVGFALYGGTALLPMLVQQNFGYTATLSGMVLSPSGFTTLLLMPIIGRLVNKVQAKYLVSLGMLLLAGGMWATGLITPQTDYETFVLVRILQTTGLPFLFVPVTALAFSGLSKKRSNDASALLSLMRNLGGSIGISLVATLLARSRQIEQAALTTRLTDGDYGFRAALANAAQSIADLGVPAAQSGKLALASLYQTLLRQAGILAFIDVYHVLACLLLTLAVAALFMPRNLPAAKP